MTSATLFQIQSALILTLIYFGVYIRKNRPETNEQLFKHLWILPEHIPITRKYIDNFTNFYKLFSSDVCVIKTNNYEKNIFINWSGNADYFFIRPNCSID